MVRVPTVRQARRRWLHRDVGKILRHAWSVRLLALAFVFSCAETAMPLLQGVLTIPAGVFAGLSGLSAAGAFVTRLLAQKQFGGDQ